MAHPGRDPQQGVGREVRRGHLHPARVAAWKAALADAGVAPDEVALAAVSAPTARISQAVGGKLGATRVVDNLPPPSG